MIKNNKTCICCSTRYTYCSGCHEFNHLPTWMAIFHDENCRTIYNATSMWGKVPSDEIKAVLDKCDLSNKDSFHPAILKVINEIYPANKVETAENVEEIRVTVPLEETVTSIGVNDLAEAPTTENTDTENVQENSVEEDPAEEKAVVTKKRKR